MYIVNIEMEATFFDLDSYVEAVGQAEQSGGLSALCDQFEARQEPVDLAIRDSRELPNPILPVTLCFCRGIFFICYDPHRGRFGRFREAVFSSAIR